MVQVSDKQSRGARKVEEFSIASGLSGSKANHLTKPVNLLIAQNVRVDKRIGALVPRGGSECITDLSSVTGACLGIGEHYRPSDSEIPLDKATLFCFPGNNFWWEGNDHVDARQVTVDATSVLFGAARPYTFAQIGDTLFIAGGRLAGWQGAGNTIKRVGIPKPESPISIAVSASATGQVWSSSTGTKYMHTYYNSSTGLESDWSEFSGNSGATTVASRITLTIPLTTVNSLYDKIKIYRTLDGGSDPYLVATVDVGTTVYIDEARDASLTEFAYAQGRRALPPEWSFLIAKYSGRLWVVDAQDPHVLRYSEPYTGSTVDLNYFPDYNFIVTDKPITGLHEIPGLLLLFHPHSISSLSGSSEDDLVIQPFNPGVGTMFSSSISTNGEEIVFLSESGWSAQPVRGGPHRHISREIDHEILPILSSTFNFGTWVASCWNPFMRQFICTISMFSTEDAQWEDASSGALVEWEDASSLATVGWEIADATFGYSVRNKMYGWCPEMSSSTENVWVEHTLAAAADNNLTSNYITSLFHPTASAGGKGPTQEKTYVGGLMQTAPVWRMFSNFTQQDNGNNFTCKFLTGRIQPGETEGGYKAFIGLGFDSSYSDITTGSGGSLKYLLDYDDAHIRNYAGSLITITNNSRDIKKFPTTLGRFIHLYGEYSGTEKDKILLSKFNIHYRERWRRQGR